MNGDTTMELTCQEQEFLKGLVRGKRFLAIEYLQAISVEEDEATASVRPKMGGVIAQLLSECGIDPYSQPSSGRRWTKARAPGVQYRAHGHQRYGEWAA